MPQVGPAEILVIMVVALLVFGPKRLPEVGRQVGRGLHELRKLQDTVRAEMHDVMNAAEAINIEPRAEAPRAVGPATAPPTTARPAPSRFRAPGT